MAEVEGLKSLLYKSNFNFLEDAGTEDTIVGWCEYEEKVIKTVETFFQL